MNRLAIVGMGPIGTSIGLALKRAKMAHIHVVGTSRDRSALSKASKMGALDEDVRNVGMAVRGSQMILLDTPIIETREILEAIGPVLEDGCIVTDTGTSKVPVLGWAEEYLPKGVSFVGGHPLTKKRLDTVDDADASLFDDSDYCVIPAASASRQAVESTVGLIEAIGAKPLFLDAQEHDSYAAAMIYLPILLSAAYVNIAAQSHGWRDMHRLAAAEFNGISSLAASDPQDNETACFATPDTLVHWLDQIISELHTYRDQISERSDTLLDTFVTAWEARARWDAGAVIEGEKLNLPSAGDAMASILLGDKLRQHFRKMRDDGKKKSGWKYLK